MFMVRRPCSLSLLKLKVEGVSSEEQGSHKWASPTDLAWARWVTAGPGQKLLI
jgi:hypothetical protein